MALVDRQWLIEKISPPLDHLLSTQLVDEFISAERRFIQQDWEPAQLDGGQFAEVVARILYSQDSGTLNHVKDFDSCLKYVELESNNHAFPVRRDALHVSRVLRTIYKFRSQRGAVHISPTYKPNQMDSKFVVESVRWVMNELLRIFWSGDRELVAKAIREILQFDVPAIGKYEDILLVLRTDLSAEEEILLLLHHAGEEGFSRTELGRTVRFSPASVTTALQKLTASDRRQVVLLGRGKFRLTELGSRRIRDELARKLTL